MYLSVRRERFHYAIYPPSKFLLLLQISYWGWYPVILLCTFTNTRINTNALCKKSSCAHLKLTGKYAFGYIEQSKLGTENIIKVMLKALGLGRGITIKIIPKIKRMPREQVTTLTLTKQRKPLVSNILIIQSPKRQPLMINIELIQRR